VIRTSLVVILLSFVAVSTGSAQTDSPVTIPASDLTTTVPDSTASAPASTNAAPAATAPAADAPAPASTTAVPAPDSTVAPPSAAIPSTPAEPVTVILKDGTERHYTRVERSGSYVIAYRADGGKDNIRAHDITKIMGDVTAEVLKEGATVGKPSEKGKPFLRGQPMPEADVFPLVQSGVLVRVDDHPGESMTHTWLDAGVMKNLSPRFALGGTLGIATDYDYTRIALKPRLRTWLGKGLAIDIAPGIFFPSVGTIFNNSPDLKHGSAGFTGELAVTKSDWVSVTYMVESIETDTWHIPPDYPETPAYTTSKTETSHYLGVKVGGTVGLFGAGLMIVGMLVDSQ
jgi:hypothetical protein